MSRNFEVLRRIEQEQGALAIDSPLRLASLAAEESSETTHSGDRTRAEILKLVNALFLSAGPNAPRQVLFCDVGQHDGSGQLCVSTAAVLAREVSSRVCVVDAKVHAPSLHRWLDSDGSGFSPSTQAEQRGSVARQVSGNLWFVPAECLGSAGALNSGAEQLRSTLRELRDQFAYVLIDAPPLGLYGDAAVLGQATDGVVLVLEANATRRVAARNAKETLEVANVRLLGTVLNNRTFPIPEKLYRKL